MNLQFEIRIKPDRNAIKKIYMDNIRNISVPLKQCLLNLELSHRYSVLDFSKLQSYTMSVLSHKLTELYYLDIDATYISEEFNESAQKIIDLNTLIHENQIKSEEIGSNGKTDEVKRNNDYKKQLDEEEIQHQLKVKQTENENIRKQQEINNTAELGKKVKKLIHELGEAAAGALNPDARKVTERKMQLEKEKLELFKESVNVVSSLMKDGLISEETSDKWINKFLLAIYEADSEINNGNAISDSNVIHQLVFNKDFSDTDDEEIMEDDENIR